MTATIINKLFTPELEDKTSYAFRNLSQTFCDEVSNEALPIFDLFVINLI